MTLQMLASLLRPDRRTALLFAMFSAIAVGGFVQSWRLAVGASPLLLAPAPLAPPPLWELWLALLVPLALLSALLRTIGVDLLAGPLWLFAAANVLYFYALACIVAGRLPRRRAGA